MLSGEKNKFDGEFKSFLASGHRSLAACLWNGQQQEAGSQEEGINISDLRNLLKISDNPLEDINALLSDSHNELIKELLEVIETSGGTQKINRRAQEAVKFENLMAGLKDARSSYVDHLNWLMDQKALP
jgi:hypothetical protein